MDEVKDQIAALLAALPHQTPLGAALSEIQAIEESSAFHLLQRGMKDRDAWRICCVLRSDEEAWRNFDRWAAETIADEDEGQGDGW